MLVNGDANFGPIFPAAIDYAEQRIYRELDPIYMRAFDTTTVSSGARSFTAPTNVGTFLTLETVSVLTPAGSLSSNGTRNPLVFVSQDFMNAVYPSVVSGLGTPIYITIPALPLTVTPPTLVCAVGPAADATYTFEVTGTVRPAPLTAANSSTYLTQIWPDLFNAALMVFMAGQMRDFGSQSDNPQMAQSWETQYKTLFDSAMKEQQRARYMGPAWQSAPMAPTATPPRV